MKKGFKFILVVALSLTMFGCHSNEKTSINILCPTGAPSLSLVSEYENLIKDGRVDFVDGSDTLVSELVKDNSEYDMIIAPINVGAKLMAEKQTQFQLTGVLTWGNLYLVGTDEKELQNEGEIALFGKGSVPERIYSHSVSQFDIHLKAKYYNSATLVQQQLISKKVKVGLLAEPLATATIAKAKQSNLELRIIGDLQMNYEHGQGYPQASIFVKKDKDLNDLLDKIDEFTNNGYPHLKENIDKVGIEKLGLPNSDIAVKSIERQNLHYKKATDCKEVITSFLKSFNIEFSDDMIHD